MLNKLAKILVEKNLTISTAESCTGGLISSMLTDVSGSSAFVKLNFVTYSEEAKQNVLRVNKSISRAKVICRFVICNTLKISVFICKITP